MVPGTVLSHDESKPAKPDVPYQSAIGAILYLTQTSRPSLSYSISTLTRYNQKLVKRVFRYLQGTNDMCLEFHQRENLEIKVSCNASYGC